MQRTDEWISNYNKDYFDRQFKEPYRSTVKFCDWLESLNLLTPQSPTNILDLGTGKGANLYYMAGRFKRCRFTGIDINEDFIREGNAIFRAEKIDDRCHLEIADIYNFDPKYQNRYDGIISLQTLSWLPDYAEPLESMTTLGAKWIALTSLFYDGDVNCRIELEEYNRSIDHEPKKTFYNIYSLRLIERLLAQRGYKNFQFVPFEMDIDLPKPNHRIMGTYTETLANGKRIQLSGPLLMNWYFIVASR